MLDVNLKSHFLKANMEGKLVIGEQTLFLYLSNEHPNTKRKRLEAGADLELLKGVA